MFIDRTTPNDYQRVHGIVEGLALILLNDPMTANVLREEVMTAMLDSTGYPTPQDAIDAFRENSTDPVWVSCAQLYVRDAVWRLWGWPEGTTEDSPLPLRCLAEIASRTDPHVWELFTEDLMPGDPVELEEWEAVRPRPLSRISLDRDVLLDGPKGKPRRYRIEALTYVKRRGEPNAGPVQAMLRDVVTGESIYRSIDTIVTPAPDEEEDDHGEES